MTLLTAGYWQTTYWAENYWQQDYWLEYGLGETTLTGGGGGAPIWLDFHIKPRRPKLPMEIIHALKNYLETKLGD